jgi:hypothetical protein
MYHLINIKNCVFYLRNAINSEDFTEEDKATGISSGEVMFTVRKELNLRSLYRSIFASSVKVFLCFRANPKLVLKFHVALHALDEALPMVTSEYDTNPPFQYK